jgi:hypothetical protein
MLLSQSGQSDRVVILGVGTSTHKINLIPLGGKRDFFSAIGHRLHNTGGAHPLKKACRSPAMVAC